jgi:hypothetical protein
MARTTFKQFRKKALRKPSVKAKYDALAASFEMKRQISGRKNGTPQPGRP